MSIICKQEKFLLKANGYIAERCLLDCHVFFNPALKKGLNGRPKNGIFIAVPKCLKESVEDVSTKSSRIQSLLIEILSDKIMLINRYFPTDPWYDELNEGELLLTPSNINMVMMIHDIDRHVWTEDIYVDFKRNTRFVKLISEFIFELYVCKSWKKFEIDFTHAHEVNDIYNRPLLLEFYNDWFNNWFWRLAPITKPLKSFTGVLQDGNSSLNQTILIELRR